MQSLAEFMAESFNSNVPLTWDLSGVSRAVAFFTVDSVKTAVEEFIEVREPETIVFATKCDDLANIYQTYLRKWSARTEELGYRLDGPIRVDPYTEFMLTRVRPSEWNG